jgi:5-amino-6-(5-phospho-D-ribitylamino)uracil phosphatase
VLPALRSAGLTPLIDAVITADDVSRGRPDPEPYLYAAAAIGRPPLRCVLIGSANTSIEAAHEVGMQCVVLAARHAAYELTAADLVVRGLAELSVQNLKQLFRLEEGVQPAEPELQPEDEGPDGSRAALAFADDDDPFPERYWN